MDKKARTLAILGDSYSTFEGWLPEGNYIYYPNENVPDMTRAEDTWWQLLIAKRGFRLLINDSSSGTTVSTSVRPEHVITDAFIMRMKNSLSAAGVNGEICVAGTALALGYYGNEEATAGAFVSG